MCFGRNLQHPILDSGGSRAPGPALSRAEPRFAAGVHRPGRFAVAEWEIWGAPRRPSEWSSWAPLTSIKHPFVTAGTCV